MSIGLNWAPFVYFAQHLVGMASNDTEALGSDRCFTLWNQIDGSARLTTAQGEHMRIAAGQVLLADAGAEFSLAPDAIAIRMQIDLVWRRKRRLDDGRVVPVGSQPQPALSSIVGYKVKPFFTDPVLARVARWSVSMAMNLAPRQDFSCLYASAQCAEIILDHINTFGGTHHNVVHDDKGARLCADIEGVIVGKLSAPHRLSSLSSTFGLSARHLNRVYKQVRGRTIGAYIRSQRLSAAENLLLAGDCELAEIARLVGYGSVPTLRAAFYKAHACSPITWRSRQRAN